MAGQFVSALEWVWYMRPTLMASADGRWRIYRSVNARTKAVVYTLMRMNEAGLLHPVLDSDSEQACKNAAGEMTEHAESCDSNDRDDTRGVILDHDRT